MAGHDSDNQQFNYEPEAYCNIAAIDHVQVSSNACSKNPTQVISSYRHFVISQVVIKFKDIEQRLLSFDHHLDIGLGDYAPSIIFITFRSIISILFAGV